MHKLLYSAQLLLYKMFTFLKEGTIYFDVILKD